MPKSQDCSLRVARYRSSGFCWGSFASKRHGTEPSGFDPCGADVRIPGNLDVAAKRDSNIALQPDATRQADTIWYVCPTLRLEAKDGVNVYDVTNSREFGRYDTSKTDNFNNHDLAARANMTLDMRNNVQLGLEYQDKVDPRGTLTLPATPTPNEYHQPSFTGLYTYGAEDAKGKLELQGGYLDAYRTSTIAASLRCSITVRRITAALSSGG